jgi:hypothetical protein
MRRSIRLVPVALFVCSLAALLFSRGAETVPLYAAREGLLCQNCHFDPNGGGPRNDFGFAYARNRHSLEAEADSTSPWHDLDLTNKVGDTMPLYVGVNQRFMVLDNNTEAIEGLDRFGFFNMESAIHFAFQPHSKLTLVYSLDGFAQGNPATERPREAFGMIGGLPFNGYIKAGRFRNPFGLRMDDHTVATRNSYLDFSTQERFLPYDPREPDMGVEVGGKGSSWFGRLAFTNGDARVLNGEFAETKAIKLGYVHPWYQAGLSFYDSYMSERVPATAGALKRATRWGYYGLTHYGPVAALFEIAAGTDEAEPDPDAGLASGPKTNRVAGFAELDYHPMRWVNGRVRYDYLVIDRSTDPVIRELNTHSRYAVEAEVVPVPFAELRAVFRYIDHKSETLVDETQGYLQFHFSY